MTRTGKYIAAVLTTALFAGYIPPIALFYAAKPFGASSTLSELAELQAKRHDLVFLPFDLRFNGDFKLERLERERPEILFLSTSRAGALRASMFEPYRFYNMSFTSWTTEQLADIFERATRTARPRIAFISVDYFLFTDDWERGYSGTRTMIYDQPWRYIKSSVLDFSRTAARHLQVFRDYLSSPSEFMGTQAILSQEGFRSDGSYVYSPGHIIDAREHNQTAASLVSSMPGAPNMSERQKAPIVRMAELARQRGIQLVAVQLPFIRDGINFMDEDATYKPLSGVWREFESDQTRDWLKGLGISFFDLARSPIDDDKRNFVDAYHTSELGALRVMQQLLKSPEFHAIVPAINPADIDGQISQSSPP